MSPAGEGWLLETIVKLYTTSKDVQVEAFGFDLHLDVVIQYWGYHPGDMFEPPEEPGFEILSAWNHEQKRDVWVDLSEWEHGRLTDAVLALSPETWVTEGEGG